MELRLNLKTSKDFTKNKILKQQDEQDVFNSKSCASVILSVCLKTNVCSSGCPHKEKQPIIVSSTTSVVNSTWHNKNIWKTSSAKLVIVSVD